MGFELLEKKIPARSIPDKGISIGKRSINLTRVKDLFKEEYVIIRIDCETKQIALFPSSSAIQGFKVCKTHETWKLTTSVAWAVGLGRKKYLGDVEVNGHLGYVFG